jgi:hypothetical protein
VTTSDMYACVSDLEGAAEDCRIRALRAEARGANSEANRLFDAANFYRAQAVKVKRDYNPCDYIEIDVVEM